jgi:hypothetical protein
MMTPEDSTEADGSTPSRQERLEAQRAALRPQRQQMERFGRLSAAAAAVFLVIASFLAVKEDGEFALFFGAYALAFVVVYSVLSQRARSIAEEITDLTNELDLLELLGDDRERRATKLLQVNQLDLKRYYDQALRQGNQIFYIGAGCILAGFAVVGVAFWLITEGEANELSDKIIVGSLAGIGGILANFIAVTYLKMFSKTIEAFGSFHLRLVGQDRVNFGNLLAAKITSKDLREQTHAAMALNLTKALGDIRDTPSDKRESDSDV